MPNYTTPDANLATVSSIQRSAMAGAPGIDSLKGMISQAVSPAQPQQPTNADLPKPQPLYSKSKKRKAEEQSRRAVEDIESMSPSLLGIGTPGFHAVSKAFGEDKSFADAFADPKVKQRAKDNAERSFDLGVSPDLLEKSVVFRGYTEGNRKAPYADGKGIAIGQGLNLTVQDQKSLKNMIGEGKLYNKLSPYVGKKYSDLSSSDKKAMQLSDKEVTALNSLLAQHSLKQASDVAGDVSDEALVAIADLVHWAGRTGVRSARSSKLGIKNENGVRVNPVGRVLNRGDATDAELKEALNEVLMKTDNSTARSRIPKVLELFD